MIDVDAAADGGRRRRKKKQPEEHYALRVYVTQGMRNLFDFKDIKKVNVPIYVSVLTVFAYILLGAALFSNWEGWGIGEGMYFCFVTLTTIGFGDVIPGTTLNSRAETQSQEKLALCALYIFFGLALIAMCFDLVQQDIRSKFRRLGRWLGILESKATPDGKRERRKSRNRSKGSSSNGGRHRANGSNSHRVAEQKSRQSVVR
jgi:potassium channel subfamily K protein